MSQPLYFLPDIHTAALVGPDGSLSRTFLRSRGLDELFADVTNVNVDCAVTALAARGPGGKSGQILVYQTPSGELPGRIGFYPQQQEWLEVGDGAYWIGIDPAAPPTAEDLRRPGRRHPGYVLESDRGEWAVPVIRRPDDSTELPCDLYHDPRTGELREPLKEAYRQYWEETGEVIHFLRLRDSGDAPRRVEIPKTRALELATRALGLNYRFGSAEQSLLRIIDQQNYLTVLAMTVDMPLFLAIEEAEREKKTRSTSALADPSSTPGPPADSPPTAPAERT